HRGEHDAAAGPDRRLGRAHARAAGVLLLPQLAVRPLDLGAGLRLVRALPAVGLVHDHRLLERAAEDPFAEHAGVQLARADGTIRVRLDLHLRARPSWVAVTCECPGGAA